MKHVPYFRPFVSLVALMAVFLTFSGCDSEEPEDPVGESELITRVTLTLTPMGGGSALVAVAEDPDGDGANLTIDTIALTSNTTYTGTITFFDGINNEDITAEVDEEAEEHQVWYAISGGAAGRVTVTTTDTDGNGLPLGLSFTVEVSDGAAATGTMNVVLSHYDEAPKNGTERSDESDVDIDFPISITP